MKAIVLVVEDGDEAEIVSKLIAATLSLNGYRHNAPEVIDWPMEGEPHGGN
jgi:hypothetical protein